MGTEDHRSAKDIFNDAPAWYDVKELSHEELNPNLVPPKRSMDNGLGIAPNVRRVGEIPDDSYRLSQQSCVRSFTERYLLFRLIGPALTVLSLIGGVLIYGLSTRSVVNVEVGECVTDSSEFSEAFGDRISDRPVVSPVRVFVVPCSESNFGEVIAVVDVAPTEENGTDSRYWDRVRTTCEQEAGPLGEDEELVLFIGQRHQREADDFRTLCVIPAERLPEWRERFPGTSCVTIQAGAGVEATWTEVPQCNLANGRFTPNSAYVLTSVQAGLTTRPVLGDAAWNGLVEECKVEIIGRIQNFSGDLSSMRFEILVPPADLWDQGERLVYCGLPAGQGFSLSGV